MFRVDANHRGKPAKDLHATCSVHGFSENIVGVSDSVADTGRANQPDEGGATIDHINYFVKSGPDHEHWILRHLKIHDFRYAGMLFLNRTGKIGANMKIPTSPLAPRSSPLVPLPSPLSGSTSGRGKKRPTLEGIKKGRELRGLFPGAMQAINWRPHPAPTR